MRSLARLRSGRRKAGAWSRLAAELIRLGKLTPYQAAAIRQGKTKGLLIGDYIVLDKIGSGGMGLVLKARHRQLDADRRAQATCRLHSAGIERP